jgi:hypothetical protein
MSEMASDEILDVGICYTLIAAYWCRISSMALSGVVAILWFDEMFDSQYL